MKSEDSNFDTARRFCNLFFAAAQACVPALGYAGILGKTTGSEIQTLKTGVVPANYTFGIWSVIFLFSILYAIEQFRPSKKTDPLFRRVGWLTAVAFAANTFWSVVAQLGFPLVFTGIIFLFTLGAILPAAIIMSKAEGSGPGFWISSQATGLLAGWTSIAIFANWSVILSTMGIGSDPKEFVFSLAFLSAAGILASSMAWKTRSNPAYVIAILWALFGLIMGNFERGNIVVTIGAAIWLVIIGAFACAAWSFQKKLRS